MFAPNCNPEISKYIRSTDHNSHTCAAAYLWDESKKADSFWRPYLDTLPKDTSNFPINYT